MPDNQISDAQIRTLVNLNPDQLSARLIDALAKDGDFLQIALPQTDPPMAPEQLTESFARYSRNEQVHQITEGLRRAFDRGGDALRHGICVDLSYCDRRARGEVISLLRDIAGVLLALGLLTWHPAVMLVGLTVAAWLFNNGYFDRLCNCP
jgi:hypothetical protein